MARSKARAKGEPKKGPKAHTRGRAKLNKGAFDDQWATFVERVERKIIESALRWENPPPYHTPTSILKREVYTFVRYQRTKTQPIHIETAIENFRLNNKGEDYLSLPYNNQREMRTSYKEKPFHWVLTGLQRGNYDGNLNLRKEDIRKYTRQLEYAAKHDVPTEFLIGFLYQTGAPRGEEDFEEWHKTNQELRRYPNWLRYSARFDSLRFQKETEEFDARYG